MISLQNQYPKIWNLHELTVIELYKQAVHASSITVKKQYELNGKTMGAGGTR